MTRFQMGSLLSLSLWATASVMTPSAHAGDPPVVSPPTAPAPLPGPVNPPAPPPAPPPPAPIRDVGRDDGRGRDDYEGGGMSADSAALARACGFSSAPSGSPFARDGSVKPAWQWREGSAAWGIEVTYSRNRKDAFRSPICEQYLLTIISESYHGGRKGVASRCEAIRDQLFAQYQELKSSGAGGSGGSFGTLGAMLSERGGRGASETNVCDNPSDEDVFACQFVDFRETLDDSPSQRQAAKEILAYCRASGADMTVSFDTYASYTNAGFDSFGGAYCGQRSNGPIVIRRENKWYDTLGNVVLGMTKVLAPTLTMWDIAKMQQKNARHQMDLNAQLGFPSAAVAGSSSFGFGAGGVGIYGGGMGGMAGCHGGGLYGGSGCGGWGCAGGYGAGCGMGGQVLVPGGAIGGIGGGACGGGLPFAYGGGGCGGFYPGGMGGVIGGGCAYSGLGGGCPMGAAYGNGGVMVGGTGMGPIAGGGMCGTPPYAPWAPGCGAGGGVLSGVPGYGLGGVGGLGGLGGVGGMPGPYGTLNGNNGWGGPWGANGTYGAAPYWGTNPNNSNLVAQQANAYSQWASAMARQASEASRYGQLYRNQLADQQKVADKSYQSYMAYQQANSGLNYGGAMMGYGAGGAGYGGAYGGGYAVPVYYPPYQSNSGTSIGFGFQYSNTR